MHDNQYRSLPSDGFHSTQTPITAQPQGGYGFNYPGSAPLPALACLSNVNQIFIKQKLEKLEAILGCETRNKYHIRDSTGFELFYAEEDTGCCTRHCLGAPRPFHMSIRNNDGIEAIHLYRPYRLRSPCCCYLQCIEIHAPFGNIIGRVEEEWSCIFPKYNVKDAAGNIVLCIKGPFCTSSCYSNVEFQVLSVDGAIQVGKISKQWAGLARELLTDGDNFGISFPIDLDVQMKAVMIGACMLIDFMYFEYTGG